MHRRRGRALAGGVAHAPRAGVRPRLSRRSCLAGALRPRGLQQLSATRAEPGRGHPHWIGRARVGGGRLGVLPAGGEGGGDSLLARSGAAPRGSAPGDRHRPGRGAGALPRRGPRREARRPDALPAAHPRAGRSRRVLDGHPRQLSAPVRAPDTGGVRRDRARGGFRPLAPARPSPSAVPQPRRFPSLESAVPRGHRLLRAGPKPRHLGRAGRRHRSPGDQLSLLRAPRAPGPAIPFPLLHVPGNLPARVARPGDPRGLAAVPRIPCPRHRASPLVPGTIGPAARGAHPLRASHDDRRALRSRRRAGAFGIAAVSWAIWITGPPGSGKSVLARAVAAELDADAGRPVVLELDEIRKILTPAPTYSDVERDVVYRPLAYMTTRLTQVGQPVSIHAR